MVRTHMVIHVEITHSIGLPPEYEIRSDLARLLNHEYANDPLLSVRVNESILPVVASYAVADFITLAQDEDDPDKSPAIRAALRLSRAIKKETDL